MRKITSIPTGFSISEQLTENLNIYLKGKEAEGYIFPVIKRENPAKREPEINWERQRYNQGLKNSRTMWN